MQLAAYKAASALCGENVPDLKYELTKKYLVRREE